MNKPPMTISELLETALNELAALKRIGFVYDRGVWLERDARKLYRVSLPGAFMAHHVRVKWKAVRDGEVLRAEIPQNGSAERMLPSDSPWLCFLHYAEKGALEPALEALGGVPQRLFSRMKAEIFFGTKNMTEGQKRLWSSQWKKRARRVVSVLREHKAEIPPSELRLHWDTPKWLVRLQARGPIEVES